jgi:glycosyltransferase involved in cell wall biosynthesis
MVEISVIICTYHRPLYVGKALASLACQTLPRDDFEVVVIDSGRSGETAGIIQISCPGVKTTLIPVNDTGLSDARNKGIRTSTGRIIAFLDDDAVADPDWLEQILEVFSRKKNKVCACGGKVDLIWEQERPVWINKKMLVYLGQFDLGDWSRPVRGLLGLNMAFDRRVFEDIGYFDTHLGRIDGNLLSCDEVDLFSRMYKKNMQICYEPRVHVRHHVTGERLKREYFYRRYYWQGRSDAILQRKEGSITAAIFRIGSFFLFFPLFRSGQRVEYLRCLHQYYRGYFHQFFHKVSSPCS